ncbi:MAG: trypsin-like peptidase domain-containing protein [Steroidobacteraceae bacterium]|nr:trypsin-like peptidase domain-containing protein [Steroidobacteraceae bacterium]MBP7013755.1 trypsin-like peptidase domain-containing protein [Steroidobacteraceae bacterium]
MTDARAGAGRRLARSLLLPWLAMGFVSGAAAAESPAWDRTLERIAPSVVTIEIDQTRAFDTDWNQSSQATGFVVDAVHGLILTNRHVVTPGPVVATAVFQNREEVELHAVYRDPVHDFGIYRYDPARLRYVQPVALPLYPAGARVGTEIRVVGNDAGEQLSILAGTLARLDRAAPEYGVGKYNDFNTFYVQAASGTSGGSSGSPVIDIQGRVVALNAGGSSGAQSSFYLPLDRVQRALQLIQRGEPVSRGTLQTVFNYTPYDELVRLGLRAVTQEAARKARPDLTGMLVVDEVLPGSPTEGRLQPGDILTHVNGQLVTTFLPLEEILDNSVGGKVDIVVERGGDKVQQTLPVGDLHAITPSEFFEFGDAVVHTLSYQMARHFNAPVSGVYVANPGYVLNAAGVPRGAVISSVNGRPVATMAEFRDIIAALPQGARAALRYSTLDDPKGSETRVMRMDRAWFPAKVCRRDDQTGLWPCEELAAPPAAATIQPARTDFVAGNDKRANEIAASLVLVTFDMPFSVAGITERNYHGTGVIVDAERGLVVVDRNTVPVAAGDVRLTFGGSIEVPGRVEYVHPLHNLSVVSFDPKALDGTPIRAVKFDTRELEPGEPVTVVGLGGDSRLRSLATYVATLDDVNFPLSRTLQFRDANLEVVSLVNSPSDYDGVITGKDGRVRALWSSFATEGARDAMQINRGMPASVVLEAVAAARDDKPLYSLETEFEALPIAAARKLGLPAEWVERLEQRNPAHRQVLAVSKVAAGSGAARALQEGDLLLAVNGVTLNRFREVEEATQSPRVRVTVLRDGAEKVVDVETAALRGEDIDRLLLWAGAVIHAPHRAMTIQRAIPPEGVFVAYFAYGSPSTRYGLFAGRRIVEVDGRPISDLDAFIAAVSGRPDRSSVRLKTVTWNGSTGVTTLKLDQNYWPAYDLRRNPGGEWERKAIP